MLCNYELTAKPLKSPLIIAGIKCLAIKTVLYCVIGIVNLTKWLIDNKQYLLITNISSIYII